MTDLQDALNQIKARAEKATEGTWGYYTPQGQGKDPIFGATPGDEVALVKRPADWRFIAHARADVPRLVAAVEAVLEAIEHYPAPSKRDDPTGEITGAIEEFGDAVQDALTNELTGEDDEQ